MKRQSILFVCVLTACASSPQENPLKQAFDSAGVECRRLYTDPAFQVLRPKLATAQGLASPTFAMLADDSRANDEERSAIIAYDKAALQCASGYTEVFRSLSGEHIAAHQKAVLRGQELRVALYKGEITFGEYSTKASQNGQNARAELAEADRRLEQLRLQRAGTAAAIMQAAPQPIYRPITFQPMQVPQPINCTSNRTGTTTYTNCR